MRRENGNGEHSALPQLMTVVEVAEHLGCSRTNVYGLIGRGLLPVICVGRSKGYRVHPHDLDRFLAERRIEYERPSRPCPRPRLKHLKL